MPLVTALCLGPNPARPLSAVYPPHAESEPPAAAGQTAANWFSDEVHAHDSQLKAYLRGSFPAVRDVDDVVQESYLRMWKARASTPIQSAKAFLFRIARNVAVDLLRRDRASPIEPVVHLDGLNVLEDRPDAAESAGRQERVQLITEAIASLPPRCREIFVLHQIKGLSRKETAERMGLSDRTVAVQTTRGIKRLAEFMRKRGVNGLFEE